MAAKHPKYSDRVLALTQTDAELARQRPIRPVFDALRTSQQPLANRLDALFEAYGERPALGERRYVVDGESKTDQPVRRYDRAFATISYHELRRRVRCVAQAWYAEPEHRVAPDDFVCIMGFTGIDFVTLDTACIYAQAVTVPIQAAYGFQTLKGMLEIIEPVTLATAVADLEMAMRLLEAIPSLRSLIVFDFDEAVALEREAVNDMKRRLAATATSVSMTTLATLASSADSSHWRPLPAHRDGADRLAAIIHSSGSTGVPKGAMLTERALAAQWSMANPPLPIIGIGLAPLNHIMGRASLASALGAGGVVHFTLAPDMSTLFEDIRIIRPTLISFFPRIMDLVYQDYLNEVSKGVRQNGLSQAEASENVMAAMRGRYLGDRLLGGTVGGAPTTKEVRDFFKRCFNIAFSDGYGNTEAGSGVITMNNRIQRPPVIAYRLRDVPELGYYTTDKPYPRGELCYKTETQIKGYYKQPQATAKLFDEDGFSLTGDIVEERDTDYVVIIDRRKDVLKLSQGEYVALGKLGTIFEAGSDIIQQIYIYGNSLRSYILAVIVPDRQAVSAQLRADAGDDKAVSRLLRTELNRVAEAADLKSFEIPRDFIIEREPFTQENGLLSSVRKKLRPALQEKYGARLEALYEAGDALQKQALDALKDKHSELSTIQKLRLLMAQNLGVQEAEIVDTVSYTAMGGDSLGSAVLVLSIEEIFGVELSSNDILSPANTLEVWARMIEGDATTGLAQADHVHGSVDRRIHADDLTLHKFIPAAELAAASEGEPFEEAEDSTVFLTGANGYLGRFACLEWLERVAAIDGKLICLIRSANDAAARQRLLQIFEDAPPDMRARFESLSNHLEVIAGDFGQARFGLAPDVFAALARRVHRICHVGALVNHVMDYKQLFAPNVAGTAEIIRFALLERKKPIDFVSTVAVTPHLKLDAGGFETATLKSEIEFKANRYAQGYGASKWAAETLLARAHETFDLPVNIYRGDMMLAHQNYARQINTEDLFSRLLFSVAKTGLAPTSFYQPVPGGTRAQVSYDGMPVNIVAQTVAEGGRHYPRGLTVFNLQNSLNDLNHSLDAFVDWMAEAGYNIERISDHSTWYARFEQKLKALPAEDKKRSSLAILPAFKTPLSFIAFHGESTNFLSLLRHIGISDAGMQLDRDYIYKCLSDLSQLRLIPPPAARPQAPETPRELGTTVRAFGVPDSRSQVAPMDIQRRPPGPKDVAIDIEYCGICHSDLHLAHNDWGNSQYPLVPGHEIIGRVAAIGSDVTEHAVGDRVAVGCMVDACMTCPSCTEGDEQYCETGLVWTYNGRDYRHGNALTFGGYSQTIVVDTHFVISVPGHLDPAGAAPLLCAGITTWSPLRQWGVQAGMKVGIVGLGGLGHMGLKFASALGAHTVMITTSPEKAGIARTLGAHDVLLSNDRDAMSTARSSFDFILDTVPVHHPVDPYLRLLKRDRTLCLLGAIEPLEFHAGQVMMHRRRIAGSTIGGIRETREMLAFCAKHNITADVEVILPDAINQAWARVQKSDVKYRFVIDLRGA